MTHTATIVLFVLGAGIGAPLRYVIDTEVTLRAGGALPVGTLAVNVIGSTVLGALTALGNQGIGGDDLDLALGTALCGALTTFSTFAFETVRLLEDGRVRTAAATVALNTTCSIVAAGSSYAFLLAVL